MDIDMEEWKNGKWIKERNPILWPHSCNYGGTHLKFSQYYVYECSLVSHSPQDVVICVVFLFLARLPGQPGQAEVTGASVSFHEIIFPLRLVRDNWPVEVRADINL